MCSYVSLTLQNRKLEKIDTTYIAIQWHAEEGGGVIPYGKLKSYEKSGMAAAS